jgi:hypothetical protein
LQLDGTLGTQGLQVAVLLQSWKERDRARHSGIMPVILPCKRLRQEDKEFKASLVYIVRPCITNKNKNNQTKKKIMTSYPNTWDLLLFPHFLSGMAITSVGPGLRGISQDIKLLGLIGKSQGTVGLVG